MTISETLLPEFEREMKCARRTLERVPDDKLDWRPHAKSMTLGQLAGHVAEIPGLGTAALKTPGLDLAARPEGYKPCIVESQRHAIEMFDKNVDEVRAAIAETNEAQWAERWKLSAGDKVFFHGPRMLAVRALMFSHLIHHRAQLGVYLRLNDVPVPAVYGPSADEGPFTG
jgi:uncharacterized damage-inducible protein DinB